MPETSFSPTQRNETAGNRTVGSQPSPLIYPQGASQVQAERERLGITPAVLEQRRKESLLGPF
jgi:hypothetical protein